MKKSLIMIICAILIISIGSVIIVHKHENNSSEDNSNKLSNENKPVIVNAGSIADDDLIYKDVLVKDYSKYQEILSHYEMQEDLIKDDFIDYDYLAIVVENVYCGGEIHGISDAKVNDNIINITVDIETSCSPCPSARRFQASFPHPRPEGFRRPARRRAFQRCLPSWKRFRRRRQYTPPVRSRCKATAFPLRLAYSGACPSCRSRPRM